MGKILEPLKELGRKYRTLLSLLGEVFRRWPSKLRSRWYWGIFGAVLFLFIGAVVFSFSVKPPLGTISYDLKTKELKNQAIRAKIAEGVKNRAIYADSFYSPEPSDLITIKNLGMRVYVSDKSFEQNKEVLFKCGLMLLNYEFIKNQLSTEDLLVLREYFANGGRVLLLSPTWSWVAHARGELTQLPHYQIAKMFNLELKADNVATPLKMLSSYFYVSGLDLDKLGGLAIFSSTSYEAATPIMIGSDNKAAAVAAREGEARIIVWGHNSLGLMDSPVFQTPAGREFISRLIDWLLE
jgi:hypothetical protein